MNHYASEKLEEWREINMKTLFSTIFKNGYCIVVQHDQYMGVYMVTTYYYLDTMDRHNTEFYSPIEVFGYMADVQRYNPKEE